MQPRKKQIQKPIIQSIIAEEAKKYRRNHDLSQVRMAKLMHVSERTYQHLEKGTFLPSAHTFLRFIGLMEEDERNAIMDYILSSIE